MWFSFGYEGIKEHDLKSWAFCLYNSKTVTIFRIFGLTLIVDKEN
jgi:hypothetical protein